MCGVLFWSHLYFNTQKYIFCRIHLLINTPLSQENWKINSLLFLGFYERTYEIKASTLKNLKNKHLRKPDIQTIFLLARYKICIWFIFIPTCQSFCSFAHQVNNPIYFLLFSSQKVRKTNQLYKAIYFWCIVIAQVNLTWLSEWRVTHPVCCTLYPVCCNVFTLLWNWKQTFPYGCYITLPFSFWP